MKTGPNQEKETGPSFSLVSSHLSLKSSKSQHAFAKVRFTQTAFTYWPYAFTKPSDNGNDCIWLVKDLVSILSGRGRYTQWHLTYSVMLMEQGVAWIMKVMNEKLICNKVSMSDGIIQGICCLLLLENGVGAPLRTCICVSFFLSVFYSVGCVGRGLETSRSLFQGAPVSVSRQ